MFAMMTAVAVLRYTMLSTTSKYNNQCGWDGQYVQNATQCIHFSILSLSKK